MPSALHKVPERTMVVFDPDHASDDCDVPTPCVSICKMDTRLGSAAERAAGGLCVGCHRSIDEIVAWGTANDEGKRVIWRRILVRRIAG